MSDVPGLTFPSDTEQKGFSDAMEAFAKDDAPPTPAPAPAPAQEPPPSEPEPEKEPEAEPAEEPVKEASEKTEPEKLEEEFVEFTGKQKERFNSVYGALKRLERENAEYQRQIQQLRYQPPQPQVVQPQPFTYQPQPTAIPKPKLADFETADQWADAVADWSYQRAEDAVLSKVRVETAQQQAMREQGEIVDRYNNFINGKISQGQTKFGRDFDNAAKDILPFAPHRSTMYNTLFDLERFPEVVMHLAKNLEEADRISSLRQNDQVYELKALEKKLIAKEALATKTQTKLPTKVEAPGAGEEPTKPAASVSKLRQAAKASGKLTDFAAVFMADPTL